MFLLAGLANIAKVRVADSLFWDIDLVCETGIK